MKLPLNRGTSILAALVFVGILGAVAWGVAALSPSVSPASQHAAAQTATPGYGSNGGTGSADTNAFKSAAPLNCEDAINRALNKLQDAEVTSTDKSQAGTVDTCYGAVSKTGKPSAKTSDYQCVGRTGSALFLTGEVILKTIPDASQKPGSCNVQICTPGANNALQCAAPKLYSGGITASQHGLTPGTTPTMNYDAGLSGGPANGGVPLTTQFGQPSQDSGFLSNAFDTGAAPLSGPTPSCPVGTNCSAPDLSSLTKGSDSAFTNGTTPLNLPPNGSVGGTGLDCGNGNCSTYTPPSATPTTCKSATCVDGQGKTYDAPPNNPNTFNKPSPGPGVSAPVAPPSQSPFSGGGLGQMLQGLLGGLAKGLAQSAAQNNAPSCSSDPTAYAQQQQQYNAALQQYNLQLQQYQMQQQYGQLYGYPPAPAPMPTPPAPCQQNSNSNTCPAAPAQPPASGCTSGTWRPVTTAMSNGAQCTTNWQCVPSTATTPTAQISCQPQVADAGMSVAISFSCGNATGSAGSGFDSKNALSGSTSTIVASPPQGAVGVNYGINCTNQGASAQAQCTVQVGKASIILVANPKVVHSGEASTIGWITSGMKSCVVSSPDLADFTSANALNTSVNGMATTSPLTQPAEIDLHCTTVAGGTRDASTTVGVYGVSDEGTVTAYSDIDGKAAARGSSTTIGWSVSNPLTGARVALWLYDVQAGGTTALIANELAASSTYNWTLPSDATACDPNSYQVCAADLAAGKKYKIEVDSYTGSTTNPTYGATGSTPSPFTISQ